MSTHQISTAAEAVARVNATDVMALGLGPAHPGAFLHALGERTDGVNLPVNGALLTDLYAVFTQPGVTFRSGFFGPAERFLRDSGGNIEYVPSDFRGFGPILEDLHPRVMATAVASPDADGWCSLSLHAGASVAELHRCGNDPDRLLIAEFSEFYPHTLGVEPEHTHRLHVSEIDMLIESESQPVNLADAEASDADRAIAEFARTFIHDGATLQTGIGAIPSLIAGMLAEGSGGGYGVHSEMFTTGLMRLHQAGKVTNANKGEFTGYSVTTFAAGIPELYTWLDHNPEVRFLPVEVVNDTRLISLNHNFVSINGAVAVDLWGQVAADTMAGQQHSGTGGHEDFVAGAGLELEDRSLLCMRSSTMQGDTRVSRILPSMGDELLVTTPRHQTDVVITEFGIAELKGKSVRERALALAEIAHPDFRDALIERSGQMG